MSSLLAVAVAKTLVQAVAVVAPITQNVLPRHLRLHSQSLLVQADGQEVPLCLDQLQLLNAMVATAKHPALLGVQTRLLAMVEVAAKRIGPTTPVLELPGTQA